MRTDWYQNARFGMFIHWGAYSVIGIDEWIRSQRKMTIEEYAPTLDMFTASRYDAREWAKAAKNAGMKYIVLTAKHHDGFCLFDSKLTDYKSTNYGAKRDLVREFTDAARAEGLHVGLYYSLLDWHHDDYPKYDDMFHPMRGNEAYKDEKIDFDNYLKYMHGQVEELCRDYGKIDILWFDFSYAKMCGEKWKADELIKMVRSYQPEVIIDNRLEGGGSGYGSLLTDTPASYAGEFVSPEHHIPENGIRKKDGSYVPWELCTTCNNHWCYTPTDHNYKTPKMLIHMLVECVSKGGNVILNVGPKPNGTFPKESVEILNEIGRWMSENSESIYGCEPSGLPKPDWGRYTRKGNVIYAHVMEAPIGSVGLFGIDKNKIKSVSRLSDGTLIPISDSFAARNNKDICYVSLGEQGNYTYPLPDKIDTVLKIEMI